MATRRTAKKAVKKAAKKTASRKKSADVTLIERNFSDIMLPQNGVGLMDLDDAFGNAIDEALENIETKSKGALKFMDAAQMRRAIIPIPSLSFQYMIGARGIRRATITEIIADEGVGKTTLLFLLAGWLTQQGCLSQYIDCESKTPDPNRMQQTLSRNKEVAKAILKKRMLTFSDAPTVAQITQLMPSWARDMRVAADKAAFTAGKPIASFVDLWSAALTASEAGGGWLPENAKKAAKSTAKSTAKKAAKKMKKVGEGSKPDHATASHEYFRRLKPVMSELNWNVFITSQRNDKVSMSGTPSYMTPAARLNDTVRGGRALKQGAALRITMTRIGRWESKGDGPDHGHKLELYCLKNSYGWPGRSCFVRVRTDQEGASETKHAETFSFAEADCELLMSKGIFGIKLDSGLYSSAELGLSNVRAEDMYEHIHANPDLVEAAGAALGIPGYGSIGQMQSAPADVEESDEESEEPEDNEEPEEEEEESDEDQEGQD